MENPAEWWFKSVSLVCVLLVITTVVSSYTESTRQDASSSRNEEPYFFYQQSEYPRDCAEVMRQCSSSLSTDGVYVIKPDGYSEVFDVKCDREGYTVIERFTGDVISFNRSWEDFPSGFGFLQRDSWLGNQQLSYLTNQKRYQLRIDVVLKDGSTFYVTYDEFRISDEFSDYELLSTGLFNRTIVTCPFNMVSGDCTCQRTCAHPDTCDASACHVTGSCVCPDGFLVEEGFCVPRNQCGCFIEGAGSREPGTNLQDGGVYTYPNCGRRCSCSSGNLICEDLQCSPQGNCGQSDNGWNCSCNLGYEGDGVECIPIAADCQDIFDNGRTSSGVYDIIPARSEDSVQVYCNMSDGGGWTVIQRQDGSGDFYRDWSDYKEGFGFLDGGMWLGNENIFHLTNQKDYELRIDLTNRQGTRYYALYRRFRINDGSDNYRLASVGSYTGTAGIQSGFEWNVGKEFSTRDRDNDGWSTYDCAEEHRGGWWFGEAYNGGSSYSSYCRNHDYYCEHFPSESACAGCTWVYLNADYHSGTRGENIFWAYDPGEYYCSMQYTEMRIRPVQA